MAAGKRAGALKSTWILMVTMTGVAKWPLGRRFISQRVLSGPLAWALLTSSCGTPPKPPQKEVVVWKSLGEWSGHGNAQTESFISLTGALRMHWQTKNEAPKGAGTFKLILQSAISGRDLQQLVDEQLVESKRGLGMFINAGARSLLLQGERHKFLAEEWPRVHATSQRLGFTPEELLDGTARPPSKSDKKKER